MLATEMPWIFCIGASCACAARSVRPREQIPAILRTELRDRIMNVIYGSKRWAVVSRAPHVTRRKTKQEGSTMAPSGGTRGCVDQRWRPDSRQRQRTLLSIQFQMHGTGQPPLPFVEAVKRFRAHFECGGNVQQVCGSRSQSCRRLLRQILRPLKNLFWQGTEF